MHPNCLELRFQLITDTMRMHDIFQNYQYATDRSTGVWHHLSPSRLEIAAAVPAMGAQLFFG